MVKCLPEFEYFTVFLKNKNIIFKIRRSKVTDYAALRYLGLNKPLGRFSHYIGIGVTSSMNMILINMHLNLCKMAT